MMQPSSDLHIGRRHGCCLSGPREWSLTAGRWSWSGEKNVGKLLSASPECSPSVFFYQVLRVLHCLCDCLPKLSSTIKSSQTLRSEVHNFIDFYWYFERRGYHAAAAKRLSARRIISSYTVQARALLIAFRAILNARPSNMLPIPSSVNINRAACAMFP